jgi:hypothetical protein
VSYTTIEQVRCYLNSNTPLADRVRDQAVTPVGTSSSRFFGGAVDKETFVVKAIRDIQPTRKLLTLNAGSNQLSSVPIVRGSVVVASDSSLGTIYTENVDYVIDYDSGSIELRSGGSLEIGQTVTAWYQPYIVFAEGVDYQLDSARSEIRRLASGGIASGETVYLDYSPLYQDFTDELLANAVNEANGLIEREVDPAGDFGADPRLASAATCRALESICRASAMRVLSSRPDDDRAALAWIKLADNFALRAEQLIKSFRPPVIGPATPTIS